MFKRLAVLIAALGVLGAALAVGVTYAGPGDIYGSAHDLGTPDHPTCENCHVPHDAQGAYLWAKPPKADPGGYSLLSLAPTAPLCLSCHDGTVAPSAMYIAADETVNHRMGAIRPDGTSSPMSRYGDAYCAACHDAHDGDFMFTKDLMREGKPPNPDNAQVCLACHAPPHFDPTADKNHPWVTAGMAAPNLPLDQTFAPGAGDLEGTRLYDAATLRDVVAAGSAGNVACLSCHGVHGSPTENDTLNSMTLFDADGREALCGNCHQ